MASIWDDIQAALKAMPQRQPPQPGTPAAAIPPQQDNLGELLKIAGGLYGESLRARGGLIGSGVGSLMEAPYLKEYPPTGPMGNRGTLFTNGKQLQYFPGQTQIPQGYYPYVKPGAGKGTWQHITLPNGKEVDYNPDTGETKDLPGGGKFVQKATAPPTTLQARAMQILGTKDPFQLVQHPEALVQAQREQEAEQKKIQDSIAAMYRQPRESSAQKGADAAERTRATLRVLKTEAPLSRFGAVGLDPKTLAVKPTATGADADSGAVLPVLRTDVKQLRQAQTALTSLDELESTLSALPKDVGARSISGNAGRRITDIVNPRLLAKFRATQFIAADAVVRAITQRGNKSQFDAAMNDIVGPHATVQSAKDAIGSVKDLINGVKSDITGRAASTITGTMDSSALGAGMGGDEEPTAPPPPPGYKLDD